MDIFFEQLVAIKKTGKTYLVYVLITVFALIIMAFSYFFLKPLFVITVALVAFGAYKLYSMLSVEYEYIITNSNMDIDKITAKSSRKRIFSFDILNVKRIEKYTGSNNPVALKDCSFTCNKDDENAYLFLINDKNGETKSIVIAPDERMKGAMMSFLPKHIGEVFK